ncbi:MAG TPA: hypothetical protein HPP94_10640 [Desulfuromonadales bacterium]|nr:hypothetical protein [Desulfuromonadales bacterium]
MNKVLISAILIALAAPVLASAETNVNINVGVPALIVPPVPRIFFETPPLFLSPPKLGFYVGVDMPYDMVFISGTYYLFQGNTWYQARHHNGPWNAVRNDRLPREVRNHRIERIREFREREYRSYEHDRDRYRGRHYRPVKEKKVYRSEEHRHEKPREREERHNDRRQDKEERQQDRGERRDGGGEHDRGRGHGDK